MNSVHPLALLDEAFPDESVPGFALRMCEANGMRGLAHLARLIGRPTMDFGSRFCCIAIAHLFGASPDRLLHLAVLEDGQDSEKLFLFMGHRVMKSWVFRQHRPQICPQCVADAFYVRAAWVLKLLTRCPFHGCLLVDRCARCGRQLRWSQPTIKHCLCNADLRLSTTGQRTSAGSASLVARWIHARLAPDSSIPISSPEEPQALRSLSLDGIMRVVCAFGLRVNASDSVKPGRTHAPASTVDLDGVASRGAQRLMDALSNMKDPQVHACIHWPMLLNLARHGGTEPDRTFGQQMIESITRRRWGAAKLGNQHSDAQLALFSADREP